LLTATPDPPDASSTTNRWTKREQGITLLRGRCVNDRCSVGEPMSTWTEATTGFRALVGGALGLCGVEIIMLGAWVFADPVTCPDLVLMQHNNPALPPECKAPFGDANTLSGYFVSTWNAVPGVVGAALGSIGGAISGD
jgi:hypothetical protein